MVYVLRLLCEGDAIVVYLLSQQGEGDIFMFLMCNQSGILKKVSRIEERKYEKLSNLWYGIL